MYPDQKDSKEYTMDDLEDIIREYSTRQETAPASGGGDTRKIPAVNGADTVRIPAQKKADTKPEPEEDVKIYPGPKARSDTRPLPLRKEVPDPGIKTQIPKSGRPEEGTPKGEAVGQPKARAPIVFPHSRIQQLRQKLVSGPERRYTELTERGLGNLQAALLLNFLLFLTAAATTMLYYRTDGRLRLVVFGQLLVILLSALVGCRRLADGITDMLRRRFRLNSMLAVSFLVCCIDGVLCLRDQRLPFGAVFSLQMLMAQWSQYQRLQTEISQMDTLRHAAELTAVVKCPNYYKGQPAYRTVAGEPEDFMDYYKRTGEPEKLLSMYALCATLLGGVLAVAAGILHGAAVALQVYAAALLVAMPASGFVCIRRPMAILERRLHRLGTVLCGWHGLQTVEKHGVYPVDHRDLFPEGHVKLNGVRYYGTLNPNVVVSYVAALMAADGGSLVDTFEGLRQSRNAVHYRAQELTSYPDGIGGVVDGVSVLAGSRQFMENMGVELPENADIPHAVYAAINQCLSGVFAVSYSRSQSTAAGIRTMCGCPNVRPLLVDCDFMLTPEFLEQKLGVDVRRMLFPDFLVRMELAEKKPSEEVPAIALATRDGLAQRAYAVTGAAALRSAWQTGVWIHILGGAIGLLAVGILALTGATFLLKPYNLLLYGCVWMIPGLLVAEWTRNI